MASGKADGSHVPGKAASPLLSLAFNECSGVGATQTTKWHPHCPALCQSNTFLKKPSSLESLTNTV